jgi:SAM-dependent methyltransferase
METYDKVYFEQGLETGKSLYNGYVWMPERSMSEAAAIIDFMEIERGKKILDFGAAKGFMVKAFRLLGREAYGCDVSRYAVCNSDPSIRKYMYLNCDGHFPFKTEVFNFCIAKDVLEHLDKKELICELCNIKQCSHSLLVIVPLGDGQRFIVPEYNYDSTHKVAKSLDWWEKTIRKVGFRVTESGYFIDGVKDNWRHYEKGNGFIRAFSEDVD